ncbi:RadC family protein [Nocardia brasiliensis]|uniref:RadC family protein n=1 Tax=Nocardia brasiliensis TaxID=37326 RepID=UPI0037A3D9DE
MRVRDLAVDDRPRERALRRGVEVLSDRELLALLLGSGARDVDAIELAGQLIARQGGLRRLARAAPQELVGLLGIGPAKAARVSAAFQLARRAFADEHPTTRIAATADLAAQVAPLLRGLDHERVVVVACDKAGALLRTVVLTEGATDRSLIPVPDVLRTVLTAGGSVFGVAHNHPSGDATPSTADIRVTAQLACAADTVGLRFLDHVVLTDRSWRRVTADQ